MLILAHSVLKHELKPLERYIDFQDVLEGCNKILKNLATTTKPPRKIDGFRFFKVRIGRKVKGRMIAFMVVHNKKIVPLLIRLKKDKIFGSNMAMNNPEVVHQLNKNLDRVLDDIQNKKYEEFSLNKNDK